MLVILNTIVFPFSQQMEMNFLLQNNCCDVFCTFPTFHFPVLSKVLSSVKVTVFMNVHREEEILLF